MGFKQKIYEDFLKPDRLPQYKEVLTIAKDAGYKMMGILDFYNLISESDSPFSNSDKILINRHDIDTSPKVARRMFQIEQEIYGTDGSATYYFRNSTIDELLIRDIDQFGYETGYHYEELSDYEKKKKLKSGQKLLEHIPEMQKKFEQDLNSFRVSTGSKSLSVASHGDFVNTKLQLQSYEILKDMNLRLKTGIKVEAYDHAIMNYVEARYADQILLRNFSQYVKEGISNNYNIIMILTHPRNWTVDVYSNLRENFVRLTQGIRYGGL